MKICLIDGTIEKVVWKGNNLKMKRFGRFQQPVIEKRTGGIFDTVFLRNEKINFLNCSNQDAI